MPSHIIKLGIEITWGAPDALGASKGIVVSCETKSTVKTKEMLDATGGLASMVFYDQREEVNVEILTTTTATIPTVGDELAIGGVTAVIATEVTEKWSTGDGKKLSITGFKSTK